MKKSRFLYCSALRMKAGELNGVRELAEDVADCTLPRFIVPPPEERDENQYELFVTDNVPDVGAVLAPYWYGRPALIDATYLLDECGRAQTLEWLPQMFVRARRSGVRAVPVAMLGDIGATESAGFRAAIDPNYPLKFAVVVSSDEMIGSAFLIDLASALERVGVAAHECAVIADFHTADFSDPALVAPVINGALELLQEFAPWQYVIFQGTHYPEKNPAAPGLISPWPRNEWLAWKLAVKFDPSTADSMMFGDYAADCAKMSFGGSGGAAIKHYRYTTENEWLIVRGSKTGTDRVVMQAVCQTIVDSGRFAGPGFSSADAYIYRTAKNQDGPGNSTTWRQVNTTHHITQVVTDLGQVRGVRIAGRAFEAAGQQISLIDV
ncbi:beta family protein [Hydrocarboniphaga sp.]|uniref:beta family protein n=1 Tax=Hydrocarboniphaga sp. TaxID=2033016 RepID=UPI002ABCBE0D|nr:hypothetical protein [Hydrocarboniphaga sp.]MDZ4077389.1 hypothetical protein [Hydrocarboniphaga sp.]